jgi:hypothetical protein
MARTPLTVLEEAIALLCARLHLTQAVGPASHTAVVATGLDDPDVARALGLYLLGVIAGAVELDASLSTQLLPVGADGAAELSVQVQRIVGADNTFVSDQQVFFRDRVRNAWISEGLGHALLIVRNRQETACLDGPVAALSTPHAEPSQSGLDAVAIYTVAGEPFVVIEETKSTRARALDELRKAASLFAEVDSRRYGPHLRTHLIALRNALPEPLGERVTGALLRDASCYVPVIVHSTAFEHLQDREWLASLKPPPERRRLLVIRIDDFHGFFDRVADTMRAEVHTVILDPTEGV